jgi:hypothetical protein
VKTITSILALIGLALSGCSSTSHYWYNPDKYLNEARQDCRECYAEAVEQSAEDVAYEYYNRPPEMRDVPYPSARDKDSERIDLRHLWGSTNWGTTQRENIFRGCMKSRGYDLVREDELGRHIRKSSLRAGKVAGK